MAVRGLHCHKSFFLVVASRGYSLAVVHKLLVAAASRVAGHGPYGTRASAAAAPGL